LKRLSVRRETDFESAVRNTEGVQPWRRLFHSGGGLAMIGLAHFAGADSAVMLAIVGAGAGVALILDVVRLRLEAANTVFFRVFAALASPREAEKIASSTWFLIGALILLLFAPPGLFIPAMLVLAFADPAASVVGRLWGRRRLGKGTWEGTTVFFLVAVIVLTPVVGFQRALVGAVAAAAFEVLPSGVDDNLLVPLVTAGALWLAGGAFGL